MNIFWLSVLALYTFCFVIVAIVNLQIPATFGLSVLRALVWPIWILTGWPEGEAQDFD